MKKTMFILSHGKVVEIARADVEITRYYEVQNPTVEHGYPIRRFTTYSEALAALSLATNLRRNTGLFWKNGSPVMEGDFYVIDQIYKVVAYSQHPPYALSEYEMHDLVDPKGETRFPMSAHNGYRSIKTDDHFSNIDGPVGNIYDDKLPEDIEKWLWTFNVLKKPMYEGE